MLDVFRYFLITNMIAMRDDGQKVLHCAGIDDNHVAHDYEMTTSKIVSISGLQSILKNSIPIRIFSTYSRKW